jgi:hypothetical protein
VEGIEVGYLHDGLGTDTSRTTMSRWRDPFAPFIDFTLMRYEELRGHLHMHGLQRRSGITGQ